MNSRGFLCLIVAATAGASTANAGGQQQRIHGSPAVPSKISFNIDQDYCDKTVAYTYTDPIQVPPNPAASASDVNSPISDLRTFEDPGLPIVTSLQTGLEPDGSDASRLLVRTFGGGSCRSVGDAEPTKAGNYSLLSSQNYVINIVTWKTKKSADSSVWYQVASNDWYLFNTSDRSFVRQTPFRTFHPIVSSADRIYGSKTVGFLAIHLWTGDITEADFKKLKITYDVDIAKKDPINIQDLTALVGIILNITPKTPAPGLAGPPAPPAHIGLFGGGQLKGIESLPDDITFQANIVFPAAGGTTPQKGADAGKAVSNASPNLVCQESNSSGTHQQTDCSFSKKYDDEGLYHWDIGIGIPLIALKELDYSSVDGTVSAKTISRENAYGLFDIYPVATDLKNPPAFSYPHLAVGLPLASKVFNKPFFGAGGVVSIKTIPKVGPWLSKYIPVQVNFYGGVNWTKQFRPSGLTVGSPASAAAVANSLVPYRVWKGQFGIEFSIRDVKDKLTAKANTNAASSTTNQGTTKANSGGSTSKPNPGAPISK